MLLGGGAAIGILATTGTPPPCGLAFFSCVAVTGAAGWHGARALFWPGRV
jgi:hypothetical protein